MERSNIEIEQDHERYVIFRTTCDCGVENHSIKVIVDEELGIPLATLFYECGWRDEWKAKWWEKLWRRLKCACSLLFKGQLYLDEEFIFRSGEHLEDFLKALEQASEQVRQGWERKRKKDEKDA